MTTQLTPPLGRVDHVAGPAGAPLELVMYGDFQCPYCAAAQLILARVRARLDGRLRFAFRHLPLRSAHPDAQRAAEASEAAAAQGAFWPMHDALYEQRGVLVADRILAVADGLGLDVERIAAELQSGAHADRVARDADAAAALRLPGTPSFFVNGRLHEGAFDAQSLIAALER